MEVNFALHIKENNNILQLVCHIVSHFIPKYILLIKGVYGVRSIF